MKGEGKAVPLASLPHYIWRKASFNAFLILISCSPTSKGSTISLMVEMHKTSRAPTFQSP